MKSNNPNVAEMMNGFERICKAKGLRVTHQRTEIFRALLKHTDHPTTEGVFQQVRKHLKTISLDTVYRTIATFEEHGLIRRVHQIDNATRFDVNISNHHHLVCSRCNKIEDFYWPDFDRMKLPKSTSHWSGIEVKHVVVNGLCSTCKKKT
ncbi:MAG: Fur family transcriptional regulator [bacterium]|nr:Fur family transcriptional regulator [bacterium]